MIKGLIVGAFVALAGLALGVFFLAQPGEPVGAVSGPNVTFPITFHDGATLAGGNLVINSGREIDLNNCGTLTLRPGAIPSDEEQRVGVTVTGLEEGDVALASWTPASATSSLQSLGLTISAQASSTNLAEVVFSNSSSSAASAVVNSGTVRVCYFD